MLKKFFLLTVACLITIACDSKEEEAPKQPMGLNIESANVINVDHTADGAGANAPALPVQTATPTLQSQPAAGAPAAAATPTVIEDIQKSSSNVEDDYQAWLQQVALPSLRQKCAQKGLDLSLPECSQEALKYGDGTVMFPPEHPQWVEARTKAYQKALINAYKSAATYLSMSNEVKMLSTLLEDNAPLQLDRDVKSNIDVLLDKAVAYMGGTLDNKLKELGVDPTQYNSATPPQQKVMLRNAVSEGSIKRAIADTTGMIPYQTFEGKNELGDHVIRVVISMEPDRIRLVKTLLSKNSQVMPNESKKAQKSLYDRLVLDRSILVNQFGTRLMYDEQGYPVLVAFGQAGIEKAASASAKSIRTEAAHLKAVAHADNVLTLLLNSSTIMREVLKETVEHLEKEQLITDDVSGEILNEKTETANYDVYMDATTTVSGRIQNFAGRSEFYTWTYEMPETKHRVSGVVLVWSPQTARHAQNIKAGRSSSRTLPKPAANTSGNIVPKNIIRGIESDF